MLFSERKKNSQERFDTGTRDLMDINYSAYIYCNILMQKKISIWCSHENEIYVKIQYNLKVIQPMLLFLSIILVSDLPTGLEKRSEL